MRGFFCPPPLYPPPKKISQWSLVDRRRQMLRFRCPRWILVGQIRYFRGGAESAGKTLKCTSRFIRFDVIKMFRLKRRTTYSCGHQFYLPGGEALSMSCLASCQFSIPILFFFLFFATCQVVCLCVDPTALCKIFWSKSVRLLLFHRPRGKLLVDEATYNKQVGGSDNTEDWKYIYLYLYIHRHTKKTKKKTRDEKNWL